ncbi:MULTISPECIES: toll/interleukin-1 receptor domain-containing protein [unclassified Nocardioides]|uniref:toll/interleukin-1 receptor domain-containing protein n=1 Tax=unclassified Nocardioides TaxID=2615069 RepID=UPI0009F14913|nr:MULTISPECIES: toll/interleukin-1 receptor domain-containing protein [unclassified Nocardioides]GAW49414.1 hypothetical protein PD653B2_1736 [Nocardioides sp. PD653-B2]GAW55072.1 hypothetical protein PD653_2491 [Nocardioides sp. PD653]
MTVTYQVQVLHVDRPNWLAELRQAVAVELSDLGVHKSLSVNVTEDLLPGDAPAVAVVLVGPTAKDSGVLASGVRRAREDGLVILPVVDDLATFHAQVPESLSQFNGFEWSGQEPERRLARVVLEQLDIEERDRRVFISHKRSDGLAAAEQLHDELTHVRFSPFIDRFGVPPGGDVQGRIADALERFAFLLLLETPEAHLSDWVFDEVDYALAHAMGLLILQWPGEPTPIPGSVGIPRLKLDPTDIQSNAHNYDVLTPDAVDRIIREVEAAHAHGIVRRRRMLLRSVQEAAEGRGATCTALKDWTLEISGPRGRAIVAVSPRLPESEDLHRLDDTRDRIDPYADAVLVHAARRLDEPRRRHLEWVKGERRLELLPENAIGGEW